MTTAAASRPRQRERSALSTARLLDAAGELVAEGGYAAMTLAAVGERAGYSRGLVTARFGSKDKLLEALVGRIVDGWSHRNVLPRTEGRSGRDGVVVLLDAIRAQAERDQRSLRVLYALMHEALGSQSELRDQFVQFHRSMRADLVRLVRRGLRDGSIRQGTPATQEAALIVAGLRGIAYQWALDPAAFDPLPALTYLVATTQERLRP
ncbi:MAG: TetR/AcrR family transcriptional regulator [Acidimicrobiales bacterium]